MASFYGKEIPWLPAQLPENSCFCHLESYLYAINHNIIKMTTSDMRSLVCSIICDTINRCNPDRQKITIANLNISRIKKFVSANYNNNLYKFGGDEEFSFPTIFRVLDHFDIPELQFFSECIYKEIFDPNSFEGWYNLACYCRSDRFVYSSSLDVLVNTFTAGISPVYADGKEYPPWANVDQKTWASISDYNLQAAAGFLFSWNRCKNRIKNHKNLFDSCEALAKNAYDLLLEHQNADGSWNMYSHSSYSEYVSKLLPTSFAVLALSLCRDKVPFDAISSAHTWLINRLQDNIFLDDNEYAHYDAIIMDAVLLSDVEKPEEDKIVSFSTNYPLLVENGPRLPRVPIKFLHLSDIHYSVDLDNGISESIREELLNEINQMVKNGKRITDLIITGDYRHAKSEMPVKDAVEDAVDYINKLAVAAGITRSEHIHLIPGNHDINRKYLRAKNENDVSFHDLYTEQYFNTKGIIPDEAFKKLGTQLEFFRRIAVKIYGKDNNPWAGAKPHTFRYINGTVFLYLNTAMFHHDDADRGHLIVGVPYVEKILRTIYITYPNAPIVVLAHHSPDFLDLREKIWLEKIFIKYPISLYLCGDAHLPWWRMTNGVLEFTAGCIKDENNSQAEYLYGDAVNYDFTSYVWDNRQRWGEFSAFNSSLDSYLKKMNMKQDE